MLLQIIKTLSIFLLPRCWPGGKHGSLNTSLNLTLSSGSVLVVLAPNQILLLDSGTSILKRGILAMLQSTLTTLNQSSLKNNLQPSYEPLFSFFPFSVQLQLLIWTLYTKTSFWPSLVTQLLQNTSLQMADGLWTQMVFSSLTIESIYYLLVISTYVFSSIIMAIFLLDTLVRIKH